MPPPGADRSGGYHFGDDLLLDAERGCLLRAGVEVSLRPQAFRTLLLLVEERPRVLSRDELMDSIWQDTVVTPDALVQCVSDIRRALGDDPGRPRFVKTVRGQGYRFDAEVTLGEPATTVTTTETVESTRHQTPLELDPHDDVLPELARTLSGPTPHPILLRVVIPVLTLGALASVAGWIGLRGSREPGELGSGAMAALNARSTLVLPFWELRADPSANDAGEHQSDWLQSGLAGMLVTGLMRSEGIEVVTLDGRRERSEPILETEEALRLARRLGVATVVHGALARTAERLRVDARIVDAETGALLAAESLVAEDESALLDRVDLLAWRLASHLGGSLGRASGTHLTEILTADLQAYRLYTEAVEKAVAFHTEEALELLQQAVARDPELAFAHARIGYIYALMRVGERARAKPHLERAFALSHRLTPLQQLYVTAWYEVASGDAPGAIRAFNELIERFPLEVEPYIRLADLVRNQGRLEEGIDLLRRGLSLDPDNAELWNRLGFLAQAARRPDQAVDAHRRYVALRPLEPNAYDSLALSLIERGRYREALDALDQALELDHNFHFGHRHRGSTLAVLGRYREAEEAFGRYLELAPSSWDRASGHQLLARLYLLTGELERALEEAEREADELDLFSRVIVAATLGDLNALEAAERAAGRSPAPVATWESGLDLAETLARAKAELARRNDERGLELLRSLMPGALQLFSLEGIPTALADAYLELGRYREAVTEYRRIVASNDRFPPAQLGLGRACERLGDVPCARRALAKFLELWRDADADARQAIDARQLLAGLG